MVEAIKKPVLPPATPARAAAIRGIAYEKQACLADVREVWDRPSEAGIPWDVLLANGIKHPRVEGHEVYAKVMMKQFCIDLQTSKKALSDSRVCLERQKSGC